MEEGKDEEACGGMDKRCKLVMGCVGEGRKGKYRNRGV